LHGTSWSRVWLLFAIGVAVALSACHAALDEGLPHPDAGPVHPAGGADAEAARADGGVRPDGSAGDAGRPTQAICPGQGASLVPSAPAPSRLPTLLPTSCNPLSRMLVLPQPPDGTPGLFHRCATFAAGAVSALALSPQGDLAAMVNSDGVARIVDLATQQVVALLAPPRRRITHVAFSPDGAGLATVAGAELEVTLYATDGWRPVWTSTLPGTPYADRGFGPGAITFSPAGSAIAVSPGANLYLLDAATGAARAAYASAAILDVAYAWGGRAIVAADAVPPGTCDHVPATESIVTLDPSSLAKQVTVMSGTGAHGGLGAFGFRASPISDLVLVPPGAQDSDRSIQALRVSDGGALPRPTLPQLPVAVLADDSVVVEDGGELQLEETIGGPISARAAAPANVSVFAVSALGRTIGLGGDGADLLHVWTIPQSYTVGVCAFDDVAPGLLALSGDGRVAAVAQGTDIQLVHPDDGSPLATAGWLGNYSRIALSRTGRYLASLGESEIGPYVFATPSVDLATRHASGSSNGFLFAPDEQTFYNLWSPGGVGPEELEKVDLATGQVTSRTVPFGTSLAGSSRGCPVLVDQLNGGAYRSCDACDEIPIPTREDAVPAVAADGTALLASDPFPTSTATLHGLLGGAAIRTVDPPSGAPSSILVMPVGVGRAGAEVLVGDRPENLACYDGPEYPLTLYDVPSGAVLDQLPPGGAADDAIDRIVYRGELWCRP
jgi:hypothetical protein